MKLVDELFSHNFFFYFLLIFLFFYHCSSVQYFYQTILPNRFTFLSLKVILNTVVILYKYSYSGFAKEFFKIWMLKIICGRMTNASLSWI